MKFDLQPTLVGARIWLRPLALEDFDPLFAAASDPLIWIQHPESDRYQKGRCSSAYFRQCHESKGAFPIFESSSGKIIGSSGTGISLRRATKLRSAGLPGDEPFWGGIVRSRTQFLVSDHVPSRLVGRSSLLREKENIRSRRALEKIGARFVRKVRCGNRVGMARWRSNVIYAIDVRSIDYALT